MMANRKLADTEAFGMGQHRGEPVQFTIKADAAHDISAIDLESAVEVVQRHAGDRADRGVEEPAGKGLPQWILTTLLPARDQIETLVELGQKAGNFRRVVLEIGVHREDEITRRRRESRCQPARLPEIPPVSQPNHSPVTLGEGLDCRPSSICRAVVDQNQLECDACRFENIGDRPMQRRDIACFVHRRNDHAQPRPVASLVADAQLRVVDVRLDQRQQRQSITLFGDLSRGLLLQGNHVPDRAFSATTRIMRSQRLSHQNRR